MTSRPLTATLVVFVAVGVTGCSTDSATYETELLSVLEDKIRGGWAGQMIGVSFGELRKLGKKSIWFDAGFWRNHPRLIDAPLGQHQGANGQR